MQEYWIGTAVLGFDGTELEVFGTGDVSRYHIYHIQCLKLSQSRSGRRHFTVIAAGPAAMLELETPQHLAAAEALITAVNQARAARNWAPVPTTLIRKDKIDTRRDTTLRGAGERGLPSSDRAVPRALLMGYVPSKLVAGFRLAPIGLYCFAQRCPPLGRLSVQ